MKFKRLITSRIGRIIPFLLLVAFLLPIIACVSTKPLDEGLKVPVLIPIPKSAVFGDDVFTLNASSKIQVSPGTEETGAYLAGLLRRSTGYPFEVVMNAGQAADISLRIDPALTALGDEGYKLDTGKTGIVIAGFKPAGVFYGCQTLLQLMSSQVYSPAPVTDRKWQVKFAVIEDAPRFAWRGSMLDVARHFLNVDDVLRYIDLMAMHKLNRLHLHLADDQGWRIEIKSWPDLTTIGGSSEVGGGQGGFFTQDDYVKIVAYAAARFITVIPEIDVPGHTNAALASYPKLNCNGTAPALYTGVGVGFSCLCLDSEITYTFLQDVFTELAGLTPGPYIHIGGDEVKTISKEKYAAFIGRVAGIIKSTGKQLIGWEEIAQAELEPTALVQYWNSLQMAKKAKEKQLKIIVSKASLAYLDMKYGSDTPFGQTWAGMISVERGYSWDPSMGKSLGDAVIGIEAPLWTEYVESGAEMEYLAFPRLAGYAELGWSPKESLSWDNYKVRLRIHGARLDALKVNYFRDPAIWGER